MAHINQVYIFFFFFFNAIFFLTKSNMSFNIIAHSIFFIVSNLLFPLSLLPPPLSLSLSLSILLLVYFFTLLRKASGTNSEVILLKEHLITASAISTLSPVYLYVINWPPSASEIFHH